MKKPTMKLEIGPPRLPRKLLLPLIILLNRPPPILCTLHVLTALFRVSFGTKDFGEFALLFEPGGVSACQFGF
jgi:hypothetical protein